MIAIVKWFGEIKEHPNARPVNLPMEVELPLAVEADCLLTSKNAYTPNTSKIKYFLEKTYKWRTTKIRISDHV